MKRALLIAAAALVLAACEAEPGGAHMEARPAADTAQTLSPERLPGFFDCLRENSQAVVVAHRGGPAPGFAENAIETFEHTLAQAPALLEIDIAQTRDGVLVLMHDDTLDRTTTGSGEVRALTLAQLQALQLRDDDGRTLDARAPTFREALDWAAGRTILELDVKRGVSYEDVIAEVRAAGAENRVIFITYSDDAAARVHRLAPELMLSITIDDARDLDTLARRGIDLTRVLAWTGTDEPNSELNIALRQRGVEVLFGAQSGFETRARPGLYAALAETGVQLIVSKQAVQAVRDLDAHDGVDGLAALQCAAPR
ncbi:MAG TPA: glycerophosphodiester phosphodiesterase family protein [Terricaulis sp.]|nr:glycerophosphodiester phosphodiesterase family protein [Terricaulis sp.]